MNTSKGKVVVVLDLKFYEKATPTSVAARFENLGLTAYGSDREEAESNLRRLFDQLINYYRNRGRLEQYLNRRGVEWAPEQDYAGDYDYAVPPNDPPPPTQHKSMMTLGRREAITSHSPLHQGAPARRRQYAMAA